MTQSLKRGRWSTPELVRLRRLFPRTEIGRIARTLNRTVDSVRAQAHRLFASEPEGAAPVSGPWSADEDLVLRRGFGVAELSDLAVVLNRELTDVESRVTTMRQDLRTGPFTADDVALLKELYPSRPDEDLAVCLSRPVAEIVARAAELCLRKDKAAPRILMPVRMPRWSRPEVEQLRALYPTHQNLEIARIIGRSVTSVANKAHQLGLKKRSEVRQQIGAANAARRGAADSQRGSRSDWV